MGNGIKSHHCHTRADGETTQEISVSTEIRQGDSLSQLLFNMILNQIDDKVKNIGRGYGLGQNAKELR